MDKKLIIGLVVAIIVIVLALFTFTSLMNDEEVNSDVSDSITDIANNSSLFAEDNQVDDSKSEKVQSDDNDDADDNSQSDSSSDSGNELKKQIFTVSENETGQNEGMEPGTYVMYYTANDGPIKVEKVG